jgi:DNA-3-methyladenine glycosylase
MGERMTDIAGDSAGDKVSAAAPAEPLPREFFDRPSPEVAVELLGRTLEHRTAEGVVAVRLTEVEAYAGTGDAASHAHRGRTPRNSVMFGPPGHAYVYFTYGMHFCVNLVCLGPDAAAAVLLRAGEVVHGLPLARSRRWAGTGRPGTGGPGAGRSGRSATSADAGRSRVGDRDLARGPARLCTALAIGRRQNGVDVCGSDNPLRILPGVPVAASRVRSGPRTGVNGAKDVPWRFWVEGDPSVSPYRPHVPRKRSGRAEQTGRAG